MDNPASQITNPQPIHLSHPWVVFKQAEPPLGRYAAPAGSRYMGRWQFRKHYYPVIADLKDKGEEFECARLIDQHPNVRHWVRNLDSEPFGFWLPTSRYRFFPDFLVELLDGRIGAIEYKGEHLRNDPNEIEKRQVGELWAARSGGRCFFSFVYFDDLGAALRQQIAQVFTEPASMKPGQH